VTANIFSFSDNLRSRHCLGRRIVVIRRPIQTSWMSIALSDAIHSISWPITALVYAGRKGFSSRGLKPDIVLNVLPKRPSLVPQQTTGKSLSTSMGVPLEGTERISNISWWINTKQEPFGDKTVWTYSVRGFSSETQATVVALNNWRVGWWTEKSTVRVSKPASTNWIGGKFMEGSHSRGY